MRAEAVGEPISIKPAPFWSEGSCCSVGMLTSAVGEFNCVGTVGERRPAEPVLDKEIARVRDCVEALRSTLDVDIVRCCKKVVLDRSVLVERSEEDSLSELEESWSNFTSVAIWYRAGVVASGLAKGGYIWLSV